MRLQQELSMLIHPDILLDHHMGVLDLRRGNNEFESNSTAGRYQEETYPVRRFERLH